MSETVVDKAADYITESAQNAARKTGEIADAIEEGLSVAKRTARQGSDAAEEFISDATKFIQRNVLATLAGTLLVGVLSGAVIGWMMRRRG